MDRHVIEPPNSVLLVVGREDCDVSTDFGEATCIATKDCIVIGTRSVDDGPTRVALGTASATATLMLLGSFTIETAGHVSVEDVLGHRYAHLDLTPGSVDVTVWGNDRSEPTEIEVLVAQ